MKAISYLITFLEGLISFISPCMLPMLPLYISYFAGDAAGKKEMEEASKGRVFRRALSFVIGFSSVFSLLGLFAGSLGSFVQRHSTAVNLLSGAVVIFFGLTYLGVIKISLFSGMSGGRRADGIFSAFLFGVVYSLGLSPCVGAFLGSALMLASSAGGAIRGLTLLGVYSLGLGIPFLLSALLIDRLETAFSFIKKHYKIINTASGIFLIAVGLIMALGLMNSFMTIFL